MKIKIKIFIEKLFRQSKQPQQRKIHQNIKILSGKKLDSNKAIQIIDKQGQKMLSPQQQDKKLVKQYKKTNKILRKQLQSLNQQIDNLILQKSNRIGLQKLPHVQKQITNVKVIHFEVQNLKKRLQHIKHDNQQYKKKIIVNWLEKLKELQNTLEDRNKQKDILLSKIKIYEKKLREEKSQVNLRKQQDKLLQKIQTANEELARVKKIQKQLKISISIQKTQQQKKANYLNELQNQQKQILQKSKITQVKKPIQSKLIGNNQISDYQWQKLKKDFLQLKEAKQQQQMFLYQENDRLRKQIKFLNQQIKVKKTRVDVVKKYNNLEPEKKLSSRLQRLNQRNTIDANNRSQSRKRRGFSNLDGAKHQSVRYRDRTNSISYN